MPKGIVTKVTGTLLLLISLLSKGYPQEHKADPVRLMFYNVENLFDTSDDPATDDNEFLPAELRRWNMLRYRTKISSLYKTIAAAGEWEPPAIIGFSETENRKVLDDLVYSTGLAKYDFGIIHEDSPDPRGIDVSLIFRKDQVTLLGYRYFIPGKPGDTTFRTRSVLYAKFMLFNDTLHLFVNHWPSRRGGVLAGADMRERIAGMLKDKADSIALAAGENALIIFAGDFNSVPDDEIISSLTENYRSGLSMVNLSEGRKAMSGTYRYRGTWEMIDQVLISGGLFEGRKGITAGMESMRIFNPGFLLREDPNYPGQSPFSTYTGYRYQGGYSDHLPVLLDISVKQTH